ncbi:SRPBCC family protein [Amycolatopsis samaneae]|uniref:SRPBCC family protein n=1 Tax=Amycolatopsis samaneae TaxID=664691 RepID=A0ABW5GXZ0_9PSEU
MRGHTTASADEVYALLQDGASWPEWSPLGSFRLMRRGKDQREGLGALRLFRTGRINSCEEVVELVPGRRFSYALRSGLPLRDYRADVDLTPVADGTEIHWHSSFTAKIPGTGGLYRRTLSRFIRRCVDGLVAATSAAGVRSAP